MKGLYKRSIVIALGHILTRALGLIIIFPFIKLVGNDLIKLYNYAYIPFIIACDIFTIGVLPGTSKYMAVTNNGYILNVLKRIFIIIGLIGFILMNLLSPLYVKIESGEYNKVVINCMRLSSLTILIVPLIAFYRGYLLGLLRVKAGFISTILEQLIRVSIMYFGALLIVKVLGKNALNAIYLAFIANFIGSLVSLIPLIIEIKRIKLNIDKTRFLGSYFKLCYKIGITTIFITIYQLIDSLTYIKYSNEVAKEALYKMVTFESHRLIIIPILLLQSLATSLMPELNKEKKGIGINVNNVLNLSISLIGMFMFFFFAYYKDIYNFFYDNSGQRVLLVSSILILAYGLHKVIIGIMEGIFKDNYLMIISIISYILKLFLNILLIPKIGYKAIIITSFLASFFVIALSLLKIRRKVKEINIHITFIIGSLFSLSIITIIKVINNYIFIITGILYLLICALYYLLTKFKQQTLY
ncbi:MAG: oligosaccharide flippase family protein [Anaeroplasmataceae bacterium]